MIDPSAERHLGRLERVLGRKVYIEEEHSSLVDRSGRTQYGGDPLVVVVALRAGAAVGRRVQRYLGQLLLDPLGRCAEGLRHLGVRLGFLGVGLLVPDGLLSASAAARTARTWR